MSTSRWRVVAATALVLALGGLAFFALRGDGARRSSQAATERLPTYANLRPDDEAMPAFADRIASTAVDIMGVEAEGKIFGVVNELALGPFSSWEKAEGICERFYWRGVACQVQRHGWTHEEEHPPQRYLFASMPGAKKPALPALTSVASFDRHKASSALQRLICSDRKAGALERKVVARYQSAMASLADPARAHLEQDQQEWIKGNALVCTEIPSAQEKEEGLGCLEDRFSARLAYLRAIPSKPYPFVGEGVMAKSFGGIGIRPRVSDVIYPFLKFEIPGRPTPALNQALLRHAQTSVANPGEGFIFAVYSETTCEWANVTGDLVSIVFRTRNDGGRERKGVWRRAALHADLKRDRLVPLNDVFSGDWKGTIRGIVLRQFSTERDTGILRPFDAEATKLLDEEDRYALTPDHVTILFAQGEIASQADDEEEVTVPYSSLQAHIRPDGPLAEKLTKAAQ